MRPDKHIMTLRHEFSGTDTHHSAADGFHKILVAGVTMKKGRKLLTNDDNGNQAWPANALKVLIVGDSEKVDDSKELLHSLTLIGYHIASLAAVTRCGGKKGS
jgi:hypothetical protein